jgi:hypothetical protein
MTYGRPLIVSWKRMVFTSAARKFLNAAVILMMRAHAASEAQHEAAAEMGDRSSSRGEREKKLFPRQAVNSSCTSLPQVFHMRRLLASIAFVLSVVAAPSAQQAVDMTALFRVFLKDGQALPSFGESAVVGDRVVYTAVIGDGGAKTTLQLVSLAVDQVDLLRTARYAESMRAAQYAATYGEADYAAITAEVQRTVGELTKVKDPARRLAMAEEAKKRLLTWSEEHYNYRADDVQKLGGMFDEVIAELRAAVGESRFAFDLTAGSPKPQLEPLLPPPTLRESAAFAIAAARVADQGSDRVALLRAAASATENSPAAADLGAEAKRLMTSEQTADAVYGALAAVLLSRADAALRRGDVADIAEAKRQAIERDRQLGSMRPQDIEDLVSKLDAKLEAAKAYRLALDHYAYARRGRLDYERRVRASMSGFDGVKPVLTAIRDMHGTAYWRLTQALDRLKAFEADLTLVKAPEDLADVHTTLVSSMHMALEACERRRRAVIVESLPDARDASSAAAGALLLADQARTTLVARLFPPRFEPTRRP